MRDVEVPSWLKGLPLAPEFHPTDTEFADPIAYISKIEKEASAFGICKIIPPFPKPSRKYVLSNLNRSLVKCPELFSDLNPEDLSNLVKGNCGNSGSEVRAVFTTRQQELGQSVKRSRGSGQPQFSAIHKQVWQSGEIYTLEQFELKSKAFARSTLGVIKEVTPLVVEALFWEAASEKPIYIEYANDVPGSCFGEPEGQFRNFNKRRRRRGRKSFNRNSLAEADCKKDELVTGTNSKHEGIIDLSTRNENKLKLSLELSKPSNCSSGLSSVGAFQPSRPASLDPSVDMEGTSGWKLSNSPWNLQVIARSAGSLTRFMPDDIPGVTSPMVYIGMLFSWFAWHIEDHELHSLNFLHTGSPKTWYAVPGEYASTFEDVIRMQVYGGNLDRLAALALLGEKTTLLSPEVVVASGMPCCRLVQNPGEFVVTFPRAYHVGFSHGFNCGEAANFGTPQWLKVAKEAAVRRAAMNHLPMLSHQQLLYLLTMSFVSRVPRSLLPGVRSSRLKDRQKEERETLVKKAFIEDLILENNFADVLVRKQSSYCHAVLWDPDLLPSPCKESQLANTHDPIAPLPSEKDTYAPSTSENNICAHCDNDKSQTDVLLDMRLYVEAVNDFYVDDDGLSCDLQVDSGPLGCVACGILGFPFMCILQPSDRSSVGLLQEDCLSVQGNGVTKPPISNASNISGTCLDPVSVIGQVERDKEYPVGMDCSLTATGPDFSGDFKLVQDGEMNQSACHVQSPASVTSKNMPTDSVVSVAKGWNTANVFLRPRIFCLEHALQIEKILQSKGGANVLVICHSDYQKIKVHAGVVAEEIGARFDCNKLLLENAAQEDLNLINLAIDDEHNQCADDWTSKLGINLQYCVKVRKSSPSTQSRHALTLGGLFCETTPSSNFVNVKWQGRRSRSKHRKKSPCIELKNADMLEGKFDTNKDGSVQTNNNKNIQQEKGHKIIQYSRRNSKAKHGSLARAWAAACPKSSFPGELSSVSKEVSEKSVCSIDNAVGDAAVGDGAVGGIPGMQLATCMLKAPGAMDKNTGAVSVGENVETQFGNSTLMEKNENKSCDICMNSDVQEEMDEYGKSSDKLIVACAEVSVSSLASNIPVVDRVERHEHQMKENIIETKETCNVVSVDNPEAGQLDDALTDRDVVLHDTVDVASGIHGVLIKGADIEKPCMNDELSGSTASDIEGDQDIETRNRINEQEPGLSCVTPVNQPLAAVVESDNEVSDETCALEEMINGGVACSLQDYGEPQTVDSGRVNTVVSSRKGSKRKREVELLTDNEISNSGYIRSPCEGLRPRTKQNANQNSNLHVDELLVDKVPTKKERKSSDRRDKLEPDSHMCDLDGCCMRFKTKAELLLHKRNRCPRQGCEKKFRSHKYLILHQRVHEDERPLKCSWKGCNMSFKWAWARIEHLRVHTGERPYHCGVEGCGRTFRYVSEFSRHRRKTGHHVNLPS